MEKIVKMGNGLYVIFPVFPSHATAKCFHCQSDLDRETAVGTGYPDGRWQQWCPDCEWYTFYDIEETGKAAA